ncbi:MAG: LysE family transporter [Bacteroidetes bacterium]|jgi:threonine/homoserine/homoserine lactone efflux protein|nr:LysE family transporter [Bacteroidota bacterium]MBT5530637.1 LysE family transporter [Cytophagia bacterium]MBT3801217.1 LysE family transporter [Bacteroidota bacterium]MBT4337299.1 LysE family transporter [Bacteroidota bacterium]MBT4730312.1 LysE family transporter [Bacteroidota bacterium]
MFQEVIVEGIILGLTLTIMIGPVFFAHLQTSIYRGFWASSYLLFGIVINDVALIFLSLLGTTQLLENNNNKLIIGIIGGLILIVFGIVSYLKKIRFKDMRPIEESLTTSSAIKYIVKGFLLNIANPFVWIFWIGVVTLVGSNYGNNDNYHLDVVVFFSIVMGIYTILNLIKGALAFRIKRLIKPRSIVIMNKVVGILLVFFGILLILRVLFQQ